MSAPRDLDRMIQSFLAEGPMELPDPSYDEVRDRMEQKRQRAFIGSWRTPDVNRYLTFGLATAAVVVIAIVGLQLFGNANFGGPAATETPQPTPVQVAPGAGTPLGWSSDGTRLLIQKGNGALVILHADGSETKVADISKFNDVGSARPVGATISPDGSRVVFAGLTKTSGEEGHLSCHDGALFAVNAEGGPAEVLWESQVPQNGIVRYPTFSPDGTQIAFADGYCDHDHSVWVMNADGSDPHQIVSMDPAGYVYGVAWSPAGDRIALMGDFVRGAGSLERLIYTFAPDGSDFTGDSDTSEFCWPGRRC